MTQTLRDGTLGFRLSMFCRHYVPVWLQRLISGILWLLPLATSFWSLCSRFALVGGGSFLLPTSYKYTTV